jgi:hypothetical protein
MRSGSLLRGEVLARWQEFVGTGEFMRSLQAQVGRLRDRLAAALSGRPAPGQDLKVALESSVEQLLRAEADRAAERTVTSWRALPGRAAACSASGRASSRRSARASGRPRATRSATGRATCSTSSAARAPASAPPRGCSASA